jgi:hypothetical protein
MTILEVVTVGSDQGRRMYAFAFSATGIKEFKELDANQWP